MSEGVLDAGDRDDDGGRLLADAGARSGQGDRAPRAAPRPSAGVLGIDATMQRAALLEQAQHLERQVELAMSVRLPFHLSAADELVESAQALLAMLDGREGPLPPLDAAAVERAVFALARFAPTAEGSSAAVLRALATSLGARARAQGARLSPDLPGSDVVAAGATKQGHLSTVTDAITAVLDDAFIAMDADADAEAKARAIAAAAPRLVSLFREGATAARPAPGAPDATHPLDGGAVDERMGRLFVAARRAQVDLVASHLDEIFEAEDLLHASMGTPRRDHRAGFYGDRKASDFDDDGQSDPAEPTSHAVIDQIMTIYGQQPMRDSLQLVGLKSIIDEPPRARDKPLFERLLEAAVQFGLAALSGHLTGVLSQAVETLSSDPSILAAAGHEIAASVGSATPRPIRRVARAGAGAMARVARPLTEAVAFGAADQRALVEVLRAGRAMLHVADPGGRLGDKASEIAGDVGEREDSGKGPLSSRFIDMLTSEIGAYMDVVVERRPMLRRALELVPPAGLQQMFASLTAGAEVAATALRADLVARWATVISAANSGQDRDGTSAHGGTLRQVSEQPGALQLEVTVPAPGAAIELERIEVNGLSESAIAALRASPRPLASVAMQRTITVRTVEARTGARMLIGRFDVGPDGRIDVDGVDEATARRVLDGLHATTEDIP